MQYSSTKFTVLITGATGGIGSSLALEYASSNVQLILLARNQGHLEALGKKCRTLGATVSLYCLDLSSIEESARVSSEISKAHNVDLFISNAAITSSTQNGETESWETVESLITTNLLGALAISHSILEGMQRRKAGHIAYISSLGAYYGMPLTPAYCASKAGLKAYAEAMRGLLASQSVSVTLVVPGFVKTKLSDKFLGNKPFMISAEDAARRIKRGIDKRQKVIAFPLILTLGMRILTCLPASVSDFFLARLKY